MNIHWQVWELVPEITSFKTSSATVEIDDGPFGASTLSSWRSESSNIGFVVLDKLLFGIPPS